MSRLPFDRADFSILVVDDDDAGRYVKAHTLSRQGYKVAEAALVQTALQLVTAAPPDLILMDVRLPDGNGVELCRKVKADFPYVTVLQTSSALISPQDRAEALEAGADSYMVEPIEPDELVAVVRALLRLRQAEQSLRQMNEALEARVVERTGELAESHRLLVSEQAGRREAESVLWHAQKLEAVGRLTGGIAHDFNNLLTVITGNLELLADTVGGERKTSPARQLNLISAALRAAEHGAQMTQQLLAFARRGVLKSKTVDLNALIAGMADFLRRTLGDTITLEIKQRRGLWSCDIDPVQFEAAVLNLTINARDAMPEGGRLTIELSNVTTHRGAAGPDISPGAYACVRIIDTGAGMSEAVVERAFEPFFTTKNIGEGSGLGLSQVYGFVNQSGGDVTIDSKPGAGTMIALYLPRSEAAITDDAAAFVETTEQQGEETILVVEDEPLVRDVAVEIIQELGYKVLVAADGAEALTLLQGDKPIDLLFSDVLMPGGIGGVALATQARKIRKGLKVLLTSGYPASDGGQVGSGEFPLLQKPYRRDRLALMLRTALDLRQIAGASAP